MGAVSAGLIFKSGSLALGGNSLEPNFSANAQPSGNAAASLLLNYSRANFDPHLGTAFRARLGKGFVNLKLVDLVDYQSRSKALKSLRTGGTESFVLAFSAPKRLTHDSAIQKLEHPALGKFDLFMTRSRNRGRIFYTAVINRIV
jgi:hypothetical protein